MLVGADFNQEALVATADHFRQKGVKGHFLWGDIGDPDQLALDLFELHGVRLGDLLNVRSFLDHNRVYNAPIMDRPDEPMSSGAFAFRGQRLKLRNVEQSLKEHLLKWSPYVAAHGLLMIELHTVSPVDARTMQSCPPRPTMRPMAFQINTSWRFLSLTLWPMRLDFQWHPRAAGHFLPPYPPRSACAISKRKGLAREDTLYFYTALHGHPRAFSLVSTIVCKWGG